MKFAELSGPRPAHKVVTLPPNAFADDWEHKPKEAMQVGLRLVGQGDIEKARAVAVTKACEMVSDPGDDRVEAYNDALMSGLVARATCMPENIREEFFPMPEDTVPLALTPDGIKLLCQEYDWLKIEACDFLPEATDDEVVDLAALLGDSEAWDALTWAQRRRLRRLAHHLLEELDPEVRE